MSNSVYSANPPYFRPLNAFFERSVGFPVPQWGLNITSRLRYVLVDAATQRLVDYVNLTGLDANLDIARTLFDTNVYGEQAVMANQWLTNRPNNTPNIFAPTYGVLYQLEVSLGQQNVSLGDWNSYNLQTVSGLEKTIAIDSFRVFMGLSPVNPPVTNTSLIANAPFSPTRKIYQKASWQANDPFVHYILNDLTDLARTNDVSLITPPNL